MIFLSKRGKKKKGSPWCQFGVHMSHSSRKGQDALGRDIASSRNTGNWKLPLSRPALEVLHEVASLAVGGSDNDKNVGERDRRPDERVGSGHLVWAGEQS